jgi:hypothetical protein
MTAATLRASCSTSPSSEPVPRVPPSPPCSRSAALHVALFDRDLFPRDKLCGEFLSYDALPILGPLGVLDAIDAAGAPHIERCRVVGSKRTYEFALPKAARGVSRMFLDDLLLRTAAANGAIRDSMARPSPRSMTIDAKVIVGAWGRWGRFDQQLQRAFVRDRSHRNFGFKRHYVATGAADSIDLYSFHRGYLGVNAVEGGITNICGLVHASRLSGHKGRWDAFVETIRAEEPRLESSTRASAGAGRLPLLGAGDLPRALGGRRRRVHDRRRERRHRSAHGQRHGHGHPVRAARRADAAAARRNAIAACGDRRRLSPRASRLLRAAHRLEPRRGEAAFASAPARCGAATVRSPRAGETFLRRTRGNADEVERLSETWFARRAR